MEQKAINMPLRLDTGSIPADHRVEQWAEVMWGLCSPMQVATPKGSDFHARVVSSELGPLGLRHIQSDPYKGRQTRRTLGREKRESYILTIATQGTFHMSQFGRDVVVDWKAATLHSTMDEVEYLHTAEAGALLLKIPAQLFRERVGMAEDYCAQALRIDNTAFRVACDFLISLARNIDSLDDSTRTAMAHRMLDILAVALDGKHGQQSEAATAVRFARLRRIKDYIEHHLSDTDLSVEKIANANDVSERYLYELFRGENASPGSWIRERRLNSAHRTLQDQKLAAVPIGTVGLQCGFRNTAHFSTAFRRHFGKTPRDVRSAVAVSNVTDDDSFS